MFEISAADRRRLADAIGVNEQYLYQCLTGRREMDHAAAMQAELRTNGELKRQMLCQRTYLTVWPNLAANDKPEIVTPTYTGPDRRKARA